MTLHAPHSVHKEQVLQDHLIDQLVTGEGYELRDPKTDYDRALAMDKALVLRFVQDTQPEEWEKLAAHYTASAEETFFTQLAKALKDRGLLDVLRQGIKIVPGIKFSLCYLPARERSGAEAGCRIRSQHPERDEGGRVQPEARRAARRRPLRQRPARSDDGGQEPSHRLDLQARREAVSATTALRRASRF